MRVESLHTYPVKGAHRLDHPSAQVEPWGLAGDRRWMLVDADGTGVTQREVSALATLQPVPTAHGLTLRAAGRADLTVPEPVDGDPVEVRVFSNRTTTTARWAGAAADAWLSAALAREVRLTWLGEPDAMAAHRPLRREGDRVSFADAYPLLLANAASLVAVNDWLAEAGDPAVPMTRFRPNVVVSGAPAWAEDDWIGRRLCLGGLAFRVAQPCDRCVVTTIDQETGEKGRQPLFVLGRHRRRPDGLLFGVHLIPDEVGQVRVGDPVELPARVA
ncbi:MAG TPA: MOSC N-terminal beta barrel domain-containing protein [Catenuloplanes sp.]|jgi:hypothetical protein